MSFAQERLWFLQQLEPESHAYNLPFAIRLRRNLNADALQRAMQAIVHRHEPLRTASATVDEQVTGVAFQAKCLNRIQDLRKTGRSMISVSHDLAAIERLRDRTLLLSRGQIVYEGEPREVTLEYQRCTLLASETPAHIPEVSQVVECTRFSYRSAAGADEPVRAGEAMIVEIDYIARETVPDVVFNVYLYWPSGYLCTQLTTGEDGATVEKGSDRVTFFCPIVNLRPGLFLVDVAAERYPEALDWRHRCAVLRVDEGPIVLGDLHMPHQHRIHQGTGESNSRERRSNA